jgi:hypothetical protein
MDIKRRLQRFAVGFMSDHTDMHLHVQIQKSPAAARVDRSAKLLFFKVLPISKYLGGTF